MQLEPGPPVMIVLWLTLSIVQPEQKHSQEQLPAFYFFLVDFVTS